MVQYIKQADIFGRLGSGVGKGLAEQLPKEVERHRLSSGLKSFESEHQNLNPIQQLARLSAIPGITPQMIQSFSELAKVNNQTNAYANIAREKGGIRVEGEPNTIKSSPNLNEVRQANLLDQAVNAGRPMQNGLNPQANPISPKQGVEQPPLQRQEPIPEGQAQLAGYNPANPNAITKLPWTPEQRDARVYHYLQQRFLPDQAEQKARDDEARDLAEPQAVQQQQNEMESRQKLAEDKLTKYVESRTQKRGDELYNDITGDMLTDMKREMSRYLVEHPKASADDVADVFSKRALNMAKTKNELKTEAGKNGIENIVKSDFLLNKLRSYQKYFGDAGNQEEYFNILRSNPENGGFGLSQQGAAVIAFPATKDLKGYISSYKPNNTKWGRFGPIPDPTKIDANSRKAALEVVQHMEEDDSPLAIARMLSEKDSYFDQRAFFEELTNRIDDLRLNARQRREISMGESEMLPTWGDIKVFPSFRRSTK